MIDFKMQAPYEGSKPFIFISFRQADSTTAEAIAAHMIADGYRVWYATDHLSGAERERAVTERLQACAVFLAMVTPDYLRSDEGRGAWELAERLDKKRGFVCLKPTILSASLISKISIPTLRYYDFPNPSIFYSRLYRSEHFALCRADATDHREAHHATRVEEAQAARPSVGSSFRTREFFRREEPQPPRPEESVPVTEAPEAPVNETPKAADDSQKVHYDGRRVVRCSPTAVNVVIRDGTESIDTFAFRDCKELKSVVLPNSVKSIGKYAFRGCSALENVTLSKSLAVIESYAFTKCTALKQIDIPDSVTFMGDAAFSGCYYLVNVHLPAGITRIARSAFEGCTSLATVIVPHGVTEIDAMAFSECSEMSHLELPRTLTRIATHAFHRCVFLRQVTIPNSVLTIEEAAFSRCTHLESITLSDNMTTMAKSLFAACPNLHSVRLGAGIRKIEANALGNCLDLCDIHLPHVRAHWSNLELVFGWDNGTGAYLIHCTDGDIRKGS